MPTLYMPSVDAHSDLDGVFAQARHLATQRTPNKAHQVTLVTPGRLLLPLPCPVRIDPAAKQPIVKIAPLPAKKINVMSPDARALIFGRDGKLATLAPSLREQAANESTPASTPANSDALFQQGMAAFQREQWQQAIDLLTEAIGIDSTQFDSFFYRGSAYEKFSESRKLT